MQKINKYILPVIAGLIVLAGLLIRLYHISDNQFLFYDEGMYLGYNRTFLNLVANNPAHDLNELGIILSLMLKTALATAKALWFFILNLRVFVLGPEAWFFARWVSAISGIGTVILLYFWSRRYLNSQRIAVLSALILLVLPSHVFYSRLGMQEALSALLFLSAIYLYMSKERISWLFFVSVFMLACVFFTNYRMIIAPVFIAFIECFKAFTITKKLNWQKTAIYFLAFYGLVISVGSLYGGVNNQVTFAWMFHQAQDAGGKFNFVNFLSYPYYIFVLEGFFFALIFWASIFLSLSREYSKILAFGMVLLQMLIFSFAAEKGARYLCVVLPFMAVAAATVIDLCWRQWPGRQARIVIIAVCVLGLAKMIFLSGSIALASTDYEKAVRFITNRDPQAVIVSTQPLVEGLFLNDDKRIHSCPNDLYSLVSLYKQGARYLILDPQAYITWTSDGRRFSPPLDDFLETALKDVQPLQVFPHLNQGLLNRFVLDHNEQIIDSMTFLSRSQSMHYGEIKIYDLGSVFSALQYEHKQASLLN
ncbi:MAG: glycosyltransferase family 39 protein [Candidatus Omnitrophica bacterium]|nr:glycosyltransferase family 39 protein [Candidatus Omnitrophota bacterium]